VSLAEFTSLLLLVLEDASDSAEVQFQVPIARNFVVELHGSEHAGVPMSTDEAARAVYLGPDIFYRLIDVGVKGTDGKSTTIFMRVSDYPPGPFEKTWNQPPGRGPFKQVMAARLGRLA
jgi:hypothetical protein